jgi:succinyl-CoA synthetase alpha subunit
VQGFVPRLPAKKNASAKQLRGSIFISHSKADLEKLVKPAARRIKAAGLDAYIASVRAAGKNPAEKIVDAISSSKAVFAIITANVTENQETRDWVLFEMGSAKSLGKKVFGWKTKGAMVPEPIKQITDYITLDDSSPKEIGDMLRIMGSLAKSL